MNEELSHWLRSYGPFEGALAFAVRASDGSGAARSWADGFSEASLENAMRCVADLFQVIQHNRIAPGRVRWIYANALLYCERRADGACLGVFVQRTGAGADMNGLERIFAEFRAVGQPVPVAV